MSEGAVGRDRLLRRHRRPGVQADLPVAAGLVRDEGLNVPIIGVAKAGWNLDQLKARAADSLKHHGGGDAGGVAAADGRCCAMSTATTTTRRPSPSFANSSARRSGRCITWQCHPACSRQWSEALAKSGCADNARLVIEKPFGHDL